MLNRRLRRWLRDWLPALLCVFALGCRTFPSDPASLQAPDQATVRPERPAWPQPPAAERVTIVVDIDETISTTDYGSLVWGVGTDESIPIEGATDVLTELSTAFDIMYLTARPQWLFVESRAWLRKHNFPPGPVLTTSRTSSVLWPRPFKTRVLAALRRSTPNILIGIGDRRTDAEAYALNNMLPVLVHAPRDRRYPEGVIHMKNWHELGQFFRDNRAALSHAGALRKAHGVGQSSPDPATLDISTALSISLTWKLAAGIPAMAVESAVRMELALKQREAFKALEASEVTLAEAVQSAEEHLGAGRILKIQLVRTGGHPAFQVWYLRGQDMRRVTLETPSLEPGGEIAALNDAGARRALSVAGLPFTRAITLALQEIKGDVIEVELEVDDGRPAYEVAVHAYGRFWEIELDARTGEILEVEDETAYTPN